MPFPLLNTLTTNAVFPLRRYEGVQYTQYLYKHKKCLHPMQAYLAFVVNMYCYVEHCKYRENIWDGKGMDIKKAPEGANSYFKSFGFIVNLKTISPERV